MSKETLLKNIEKLSPFVSAKIWGGKRLAQRLYGHEKKNLAIGELWEVSRLENSSCKSSAGELDKILNFSELPYLVKYIDTSDNLSIQVHPDDSYARKVERSSGKTECWLILEAHKNSGIYLGFKPNVKKNQFTKALKKGEDITSFLNFYPIQKETFVIVPSGTIHAIGKDVLLLEVQQSSGITYRLWDWNRTDDKGNSRTLHVNKAMDVLNFHPECNEGSFFHFKENVFLIKVDTLIAFKDFSVISFSLKKGESVEKTFSQNGRYRSFLVLKGFVELRLNNTKEIYKAQSYETYLIQKSIHKINILCLEEANIIVVF